MTEGERGTFGLMKYYFFEKYYYAGSFHHFVVPLPPGGRLLSRSLSLENYRQRVLFVANSIR